MFSASALLGFVTISNMYLQNIGKTIPASILAMARQGLFFIPITIFAVHSFRITALQIAQPISDVLTFILSLPLGISTVIHLSEVKST